MLTFFNQAADDLSQLVGNLSLGKYSQLRGTTMKTSSSLNYIQLVLLPVLTALYDHLGANEFGSDLICTYNKDFYTGAQPEFVRGVVLMVGFLTYTCYAKDWNTEFIKPGIVQKQPSF